MASHGTVAEVAELGSAAFRHFGLVWRRHTKIQIGMAAAIPVIQLPAPLYSAIPRSPPQCLTPYTRSLPVATQPCFYQTTHPGYDHYLS